MVAAASDGDGLAAPFLAEEHVHPGMLVHDSLSSAKRMFRVMPRVGERLSWAGTSLAIMRV